MAMGSRVLPFSLCMMDTTTRPNALSSHYLSPLILRYLHQMHQRQFLGTHDNQEKYLRI
jgi:hypothetical protein